MNPAFLNNHMKTATYQDAISALKNEVKRRRKSAAGSRQRGYASDAMNMDNITGGIEFAAFLLEKLAAPK